MLLLAELAEDRRRLLEELERRRVVGAVEREREVVERQRLGPTVAEVAEDCEREPVLLGRFVACALASQLDARGIRSNRVPLSHARCPCRPRAAGGSRERGRCGARVVLRLAGCRRQVPPGDRLHARVAVAHLRDAALDVPPRAQAGSRAASQEP